jgi:hypothetical protein
MNQRLPARVYWVRRAGLLLALALVVLVGWLIVRAALGSRPEAEPPTTSSTSTTTPKPSPTGTSTPHPGGIPDCAAADLALTIVPGAPTFAAGVSPTFTITITDNGPAPCLVDAGETHRAIVITSGTDRVWSNQDCAAADAGPRTLLLTPKQADTTQLAWNLVRSAPGCPTGLLAPAAGMYVASFTVGGATGAPAAFALG